MLCLGVDIKNIWLCEISYVVTILQNENVTFYNISAFKNYMGFFLIILASFSCFLFLSLLLPWHENICLNSIMTATGLLYTVLLGALNSLHISLEGGKCT